jgi:hypothetical protein
VKRHAIELDPAVHRARPWRVHGLAADFKLLDVWRVPIVADPARGDRFLDFQRIAARNGERSDSRIAQGLFALRERIGRLAGWDDHNYQKPIPGCSERFVRERLTDADRARDRSGGEELPHGSLINLRSVYLFDDESLQEVSNDTIHALLHLGWVDDDQRRDQGGKTIEMAVYVKSRGLRSDLYMASIGPFRHLLVYPPWIARLVRLWNERAS